ncbi:MAG: hypothetical protein HLUCCA13_06640 [Halomonas sp. HL-48]|nr:LolA-related protein [Halomonas sp. HL-48]KPQ25190.1 MAG: hypothetical protein HLUCCA13_06640 [Halomonas sp. HL-48]
MRPIHWTMVLISVGMMVSTSAVAAPDEAALAERLAANAPQCGRFEQSRWMADLDTQLESRGYFEHQEDGLVWQTTAPINDRVLLSEDNDELPKGFQVIAPMLGGLLAGDWQRLEKYFTTELSGEEQRWQATLTPNEASIAERLTQLHVRGSQQVDEVEIDFANDDRLSLTLTAADCDSLDDSDPAT